MPVVERLQRAGVNVCLGTDSLASGDSLSMFAQMQEFARVFPKWSAEEILRFYAKVFGIPRAEADKRIDSLIKLVELEHARSRPLKSYSKGMQQRVGLAGRRLLVRLEGGVQRPLRG